MIEQVYYINLERRRDRRSWMELQLMDKRVPASVVERIVARDHLEVGDYEAMCREIEADGFPVPIFSEECRTAAFAGCYWSQMKVFRKIADSDRTAVIFEDDYCFNYPWLTMLKTMDFLRTMVPQVDIVQLGWWQENPHARAPEKSIVPGWYKGISSLGQWGNVYTPYGAERMLGAALDFADSGVIFNIEVILLELEPTGVYSSIACDLLTEMPESGSEVSATMKGTA